MTLIRLKYALFLNLPYEVIRKEFESREHALNWIIANQLGRRNLSDENKRYLMGKMYETRKKIITNAGGANQYKKEVEAQVGQQPKNNTTAKIIGEEYGVGYNTVRRAEHFAKTVDILPEEVKQDVLSGDVKITNAEATTISKMEETIKKAFVKEVEKGTPIKEAVKKVDPELKRRERDDFIRAEMQRKQEIQHPQK